MNQNLAGAALMLLGMAVFAVNDAIGKWLVADYGVAQVILLRSLAALAVLAVVMLRTDALARLRATPRPGVQALRAACTTLEVFCFYYAVQHLPLADVMAFWMAGPILVVAVSPLVLGESVSARAWVAVLAGFLGVLVLLGPSASMFAPAAIIALIGTAAFAAMMVLGRFLRATPDSSLVLFQTLAAAVAGLVLAPVGWAPLQSGTDLSLLFLLGIVAMVAHVLVTRALKLAEAAVVAPLQYTLLVWGVIFGWLFFDDIPAPEMMLGAALIVGSGLFLLRRSPPAETQLSEPSP